MNEHGLWFSKEEGWFFYFGDAYSTKRSRKNLIYKTYSTNATYYWPSKYKGNTRISGGCLGRWVNGEEN